MRERRSCASSNEVRSVDSSEGSIGKVATPVYTEVDSAAACWSVAEPLGTEASTSAIPTNRRTVPSGSLSTYSTWSRSRELSLSMDDQSSERRSRAAGAAIFGGAWSRSWTSRATSAGKSGWNPASSMAWCARALRSYWVVVTTHSGSRPAAQAMGKGRIWDGGLQKPSLNTDESRAGIQRSTVNANRLRQGIWRTLSGLSSLISVDTRQSAVGTFMSPALPAVNYSCAFGTIPRQMNAAMGIS